jgi:LPXTG-motif cell wall-anchored protein
MPTGLAAYWTANPANNYIGGQNAQDFAITGSKMYYGGPQRTGVQNPGNPFWSNDLICWDYSTDALCVGFDGTGRGINQYYTADIDPENPGCVWVNQNSGQIIPLNAETGEVGCSSGEAVVELPYAGVVPRMGCESDGRVISWEDIQLNLNGVSSTDVAISILDDNGAEVADWQDVPVDSTGYLDMSTLTVAESSTTPSIQIVGLNGVTLEELELITGIVTFEAEEPEFCFALQAITNCPDESVNNPTVADVPAGIIEGSSITYPTSGAREVGSKQRTVIPGTNAGSLCASSAWSAFIPTLAETGFDTVPVALGGLVAVAAGIGAAVYTKRRRNRQ